MTTCDLGKKSVLIVGLGGLGCPAALALAKAKVGHLVLCDDDLVDETNLHRQVLYRKDDVGRDKLDAAKDALEREGALRVSLIRSRILPENALDMCAGVDLVLEGADNFPTKFLVADACHLTGRPVIHGAGIRFSGTAWSVAPHGRPCYRCLFEDLLPREQAPNCQEAGVFGPVVGVLGALLADLALDSLAGDYSRTGEVYTFDALRLTMRAVPVTARADCALCGLSSTQPIRKISRESYEDPRPSTFDSLAFPLESKVTIPQA